MRRGTRKNIDLHGNVPDECSVALLLLDVLNDLEFPGAAALVRTAPRLAANIARLKRRCRKAGIPAIYVNDNRKKWRSDSFSVLEHCLRPDTPGRALVEPLVPSADDYIVLKPKHSAFYATPLDTLLTYLKSRTIILVGLTTDACVLTTACEIHIRDLDLFVPSDCVAALDAKQHAMALKLMAKSFDARTTPSQRLDLKKLVHAGRS
jgi:nicotinamidase-related amidase